MKRELKKFQSFKKEYEFKYLNLVEKDDGIYFEDLLISNSEEIFSENEKIVNVGYKLKGAHSKLLSNLFPYEFVFKGKKVASIEGVFQGIKFPDKKMQNLVLKMSGADAVHIKNASDYDWKLTGELFWQGKAINRYEKDYQNFVDELYISALQNPLYKQALINIGEKYILHSMGAIEKENTVFTRFEFEEKLNTLKAYALKYHTIESIT